MLGQVVVDGQRVLALVEEVLGHRRARVWREELDRRGLVGGSGHDDRVLERPGFLELARHVDDHGHALADRDVDADQVAVLVVDDRVDADRRLAGLAVADDQLALATTDVGHRVDGLDAGHHRLLDRLTGDHARGLELGRPGGLRVDVALAVQRLAQRVDDPPQQRIADRHLEKAPGALDLVALLDLVPLAEEHRADVVRLEVQRQPSDVVGKLEQLAGHDVVEPVDARDAVGHGEHRAHLGEVGPAVLEPLDAVLEDAGDLVWLDLHWERSP